MPVGEDNMKLHVGTAWEGAHDGCWILGKPLSSSVTGFHLSSDKEAGFYPLKMYMLVKKHLAGVVLHDKYQVAPPEALLMNLAPCPYSQNGLEGLCPSLPYKSTQVWKQHRHIGTFRTPLHPAPPTPPPRTTAAEGPHCTHWCCSRPRQQLWAEWTQKKRR